MRKSKLQDGTPFVGIKVEHFVKASDFAHALADHCWTKSIDFNPKIKKAEAIEILKRGLFFNGLSGEFDGTHYEGASQDAFDAWNIPYKHALDWVHKNYPYLTNPTK